MIFGRYHAARSRGWLVRSRRAAGARRLGSGLPHPIVLVSPYAKHGQPVNDEFEPGSVLCFIVETFGLPTLHTSDLAANNSSSVMFDFTQTPTPFKTVASSLGALYRTVSVRPSIVNARRQPECAVSWRT